MVVGWANLPTGACLWLDLLGDGGKAGLGVAQEDEPKNNGRELGGLEVRIGPELVRRIPKGLFKLGVGVFGGCGFSPMRALKKELSAHLKR